MGVKGPGLPVTPDAFVASCPRPPRAPLSLIGMPMLNRHFWTTTLALGLLLNLLGWIGNAFLLRPLWREALAQVHLLDHPWRQTLWKEVLSTVPDFIYAGALVWLYAHLVQLGGSRLTRAMQACLLIFIVGVLTTYVGTANAGLLPFKVSLATTLWALVTFIPAAWLLSRIYTPS